jgi:hypothetical protein
MLGTDKAENCLYLQNGKLNYHRGYLTQDYLKNSLNAKSYHLYIISDEKPKVGDWSINLNSQYAHKELCSIDNEIELKNYVNSVGNDCRKIIATTDPSLGLPSPSESFIKAYIEAYNNGNVIEDVLIEVECPQCQEWGYVSQCRNNCNQKFLQPKLKDNNIIIRKVKDSWTREEVQQLLSDLGADLYHKRIGNGLASIEKWIEENL